MSLLRRLPALAIAGLSCAGEPDGDPDVVLQTAHSTEVARENVLEVASFGAIPDDDLDDTEAIQATIDAARGISAVVRLEPGTYLVSERDPIDWNALRVHEGRELTIAGAGAGQTRLVFCSERDAHVIALTDCVDVIVQGLSVDGQREHHQLGHGIRVASGEDITLRDLEIDRAAHYGIGLQRGALRRIVIDQVRINDTGADAIDFNNELSENDALSITNVFISAPAQVDLNQAGIDVRGPALLRSVTVVDVPPGAVGIRLRGDSELSGRGAHHSVLSGFDVSGYPGSVGVAVEARDVRVENGSVAGTGKALRLRTLDVSIEGVGVAP